MFFSKKSGKKVNKKLFLTLVGLLLIPSFQCFGELDTSQIARIERSIKKNDKKRIESGSYRIKDIFVENNKFVRKKLILNAIPYKPGDIFEAAKSSTALDNLYALGNFCQVALEVDKVGSDQVNLYVVVQEKKLLEELKIKGNKALSKKKIREQLNLDKLTMIDEESLRKIALAIKKLYKEENRHFVRVDTKLVVSDQSPDKATAKIEINEGVSSSVARVMFKGNKKIPSRTLASKIYTRENWILNFMDGAGVYKDDMLEMDKHRIAYLYRDQGYMMAKVKKVDVKFSDNKRNVFITFHIEEGDQFTIRSIKAPGDEIFLEKELTPLISLEVGEPYSQSKAIASLNRLRDLWGKKGYIYADVYPQIKPDEKTKEVDVAFHVDRGNKLYVNRIAITGNNVTLDKVIRRQLDIFEGDLITTQKLSRSQNGVEYLGYFKREEIN